LAIDHREEDRGKGVGTSLDRIKGTNIEHRHSLDGKENLMSAIPTKNEANKGYDISWPEPPLTSASWQASVASDDPVLYAKMAIHGSEPVEGRTRDEMITKAKAYVDSLGV
jgi:hypothetical protein